MISLFIGGIALAVVRRFRTLGQVRQVPREASKNVKPVSVKVAMPEVVAPAASSRKRRSDRRHEYPLRAGLPLWGKITELNMNSKGLDSGPSLNDTICDLLEAALSDEMIKKRILDKFPERGKFIVVRTWGRD